jgi:hypothetical protein
MANSNLDNTNTVPYDEFKKEKIKYAVNEKYTIIRLDINRLQCVLTNVVYATVIAWDNDDKPDINRLQCTYTRCVCYGYCLG